MRKLVGFGIFAVLINVVISLGAVCTAIYGLILAFKASVLLGIIVLLVEPSPFILGVAGLLGHPDLAQRIAHFLGI